MDGERELLKGNTPTLILAVLRDGPLHGYAIAREIEARSGSALTCKEGTLYPALHSLERQELIAGEWADDTRGRPRRVYSLTAAGRAALEERARTWARFATAIERVIGGSEDVPAPPAARPGPLRRHRIRRSGPLPEPTG